MIILINLLVPKFYFYRRIDLVLLLGKKVLLSVCNESLFLLVQSWFVGHLHALYGGFSRFRFSSAKCLGSVEIPTIVEDALFTCVRLLLNLNTYCKYSWHDKHNPGEKR